MFVRIAAALFFASYLQSSSAESLCSLVSKLPATVEAAGVKTPTPIALQNCEGVRVLSGEVFACFLDASGKRNCATFVAGQRVSVAKRASSKGGVAAMALAFWHELRGAPSVGLPEVRNGGGLKGVPYDLILARGDVLRFDLARTEVTAISAFELREGANQGRTIAFIDKPSAVVDIAPRKLKRGGRYNWVISGAVGDYRGTFTLAGPGLLRRMQADLTRIESDKTLDATSKTLLLGDLLYRSGLRFDALELLRAAGFELK
jgi:hypothetical protein